MLLEECVQCAGRAADIERAPDRRFTDPVHHRCAGGFDDGQLGQLVGQLPAEADRAPPRSGPPAVGSGRSARAGSGSSRRRHRRRTPRSAPVPGDVSAPRPTSPSAVASSSRSPTGPGCSRSDQRGRRHNSIRDASAASSPARTGNSASRPSSSRRSSGAAVENNASESAAIGLLSAPRRPVRPGRDGRSSHVVASRCHRSAIGDSVKRSACTVGAQYGPSPSSGSGRGRPDGDQPRRGADFQDQPEPLLVDTRELGQPFDFAYPEAAAAQLGNRCGTKGFEHQIGFAQHVDHRAGGRGIGVGGRRGGGGRRRLRQADRTRLLAAQHLAHHARQDHGLVVDLTQQTRGEQPLHGPVGRRTRGGVAGPADRRAGLAAGPAVDAAHRRGRRSTWRSHRRRVRRPRA